MLLGSKRAIFKVVISVLWCTLLAGQTEEPPETVGLTSSITTPMANNKNPTSNVASSPSNEITSPTMTTKVNGQNKVFSDSDKRKVRIVTMTVAAMGILFNAAVILAIIIDPLKVLRKGSWITIFNLAIADFLSCISGFCLWGTLFFGQENNLLYQGIINFGFAFGVSASFIFLTFLTVQIYFFVNFPFKSRFMFTTTKIAFATIVIWLFASLWGLSQLAYLLFTIETSLKIYMIGIGVLEIALFIQVLLNFKVIAEIMRSGRNSVARRSCQINKHRKIAKTVVILTLILFFTAFPYYVFKQIEYCARLGYFGKDKTADILSYLSYCYVPIVILNFSANPILYSLRLPDYKQTLLAFVGRAHKGKAFTSSKTTFKFSKKQLNPFSIRVRWSKRHSVEPVF